MIFIRTNKKFNGYAEKSNLSDKFTAKNKNLSDSNEIYPSF
jgi:hypothetical protein